MILLDSILGFMVRTKALCYFELICLMVPAILLAREDFRSHTVSGELFLGTYLFFVFDSICFKQWVALAVCVLVGILVYSPLEFMCFGDADWLFLLYIVCIFCKIPQDEFFYLIGILSLSIGLCLWVIATATIFRKCRRDDKYIPVLPALPICDLAALIILSVI